MILVEKIPPSTIHQNLSCSFMCEWISLNLPPLTFCQYSPLIPNMPNTHNTFILKAQHRKTSFDFKFMSTQCLSQGTI